MIDRIGLADFLRRRREALTPADLGLPGGMRKRAPGLRRDEVASQAGISYDYYARLEQHRGANPSESVIAYSPEDCGSMTTNAITYSASPASQLLCRVHRGISALACCRCLTTFRTFRP